MWVAKTYFNELGNSSKLHVGVLRDYSERTDFKAYWIETSVI